MLLDDPTRVDTCVAAPVQSPWSGAWHHVWVSMRASRPRTGRKLFWAAFACAILTPLLFLGGFTTGNGFGSHTAMTILLVGMVLSVVTSLVTFVMGVAGTVAFPALRGRYVLVLVLSVVFSPLLWLLLFALFA